MTEPRMVAVFTAEEHLLSATRAVRDRGWAIEDIYTPYAVHGLDRAMGQRPTRLPIASFLFGLFGASFIFFFQFWTNSFDWPLNVGGKPINSWPAFVPVTFEMMVLFGGLGSVATLLVTSKLFPGKQARMPIDGVTNDRFALVLAPQDAAFSTQEATELFEGHEALSVEEWVEEDDR